jgi:hypothetical protein
LVTEALPEMEEWLQLMVILVADFYRDNNRTDVVTNYYRFVAIFSILGAKETDGKFHAVLSFFVPFFTDFGCKYSRVLGMESLTR